MDAIRSVAPGAGGMAPGKTGSTGRDTGAPPGPPEATPTASDPAPPSGPMSHDDEDLGYVPRATGPGVGDPAALAVGSVVLATLSLAGFGLLNGSNDVYPFTDGMAPSSRAVLAGLLAALLALPPVVMGLLAHRRTHPGDPTCGPTRTGRRLLAGVAIVLRLVATAVASVSVTESGYGPLL